MADRFEEGDTMSIYTIEECFLYKDSIKIAGLPIYIFDDHSMALPAWGVCSSRLGKPLNLITFDSHTDTHPSFNSFVVDQTGKCAGLWHRGLKNPEIKKLLENVHYCADDFCFEDVYKITVSYLKNSEQILTGVDLGYLSSYVVVTKERDESLGYERDDRMLGYNATYLSRESWDQTKINAISDPLVVDFDLDFFGASSDFDEEFIANITPLIKRATAITIAREPKFFEICRTEENYTNEMALAQLLNFIRSVLSH